MTEAKHGVILAGGRGTRIGKTAPLYNKHIALAYDRPVIHYPLSTLREMGCDTVTIVSTPTGVGEIARAVGDGSDFKLDVHYKVQRDGSDIGHALSLARVDGLFPMMLGDCYYDPAPPRQTHPTLFWHDFPTATEHSVWSPEMDAIIEKPRGMDIGRRAVISYYYDERVYDFIERFKPAMGAPPLEIVDLHNFYRESGAEMVEYTGFFGDMGTPDGLLRVVQHERDRRHEQ